jgi:uncharacterized protein (DUF1330 family)
MSVNPTREQLAAVAAVAGTEADGPLVMLNLNRYRERAAYEADPPGGGSPDVSGREAYERYGAKALEVLTRLGGEIRWHSHARMTVIGEAGEEYDEVIAVAYPSAQAFLALALDPEIGAALAHRDAGLERAALIWCEEGADTAG